MAGLTLHDHVLAGHAHRAMRQGDRYDHGQEFRCKSDRERQREQEGFEQPVDGTED